MQLTGTSSSIHLLTQEDKSEHHSQDIYTVLNRKNSLKQKCQLYNIYVNKKADILYKVVANIIRTLVFSPAKTWF